MCESRRKGGSTDWREDATFPADVIEAFVTDLSRRRLLRLALAGASALSLAACGKRGALQAPPTEEENANEARRAAGDPTAPRPKQRKAGPIPSPRKDTPFDFLL